MSDNLLWGGVYKPSQEKPQRKTITIFVEKNFLLLKQIIKVLIHFHLLTILSKDKIYSFFLNAGHKFIQLPFDKN